jgi:hypothetical protein
MENAMTAQQDIRRRIDGSIDIDFYRQKGLMERRVVMTGSFRNAGKPLAAAALVMIALYAVSPRDGTAGHGVNTVQTGTSLTR